MFKGLNLLLMITLLFGIAACNGGGGSGGFADLSVIETPSSPEPAPENIVCNINSRSPNSASVKVPSVNGVSDFGVVPSNVACTVSYSLNGSALDNAGSSFLTLNSNQLSAGNNTLTVTVSGAGSSSSASWTVTKNTPPECSSQNPTPTGNEMLATDTLVLNGTGASTDGDSLTYSWKLNNQTAASKFSITTVGNSSTAIFIPNNDDIGANAITLNISDGYDTTTCNWSVNVGTTATCSINDSIPAAANVKVSGAAGSSTVFAVSPSSALCNITYTLNGNELVTHGSAFVEINSNALFMGGNVLTVDVRTGASGQTKTWNIVKNIPPTCSSQNPNQHGNTMLVSSTLTLAGVAGNLDADPLTFAWKLNGALNPGKFAITTNDPNSSAIFDPDMDDLGVNEITLNFNDGYDTAACTWNVSVINPVVCSIANKNPLAATYKMSAAPATSALFAVERSSASCSVTYTLNGAPVATGGSSFATITSGVLNEGNNSLVVEVFNGTSSEQFTWTVVKNAAPTCADQNPGASNNNMLITDTINLESEGGSSDGDPLTFVWKLNGNAAPAKLTVTTVGNDSDAVFDPTNDELGANTVTNTISDGYDTAVCSWGINVSNPVVCAISEQSPVAATIKVANNPATSTAFGIVPSSSSCNISYTLNAGLLPTGGAAFLNLTSASLNDGDNTLVGAVALGGSSANTTWTVRKNSPPACANIVPGAVGNSVNVGSTITFSADATNTDGDPLTYTWKLNSAVAPAKFAQTNGVNTTQVVYTPTGADIGNNLITVDINDSYDTATCSWNVAVADPNVVHISACTPSAGMEDPVVVTSVGGSSTRTFSVTATGTGITYSWILDGAPLGVVASTASISSLGRDPGTYTLIGRVVDAYANEDQCTFNVKINAPPVLTVTSPATDVIRKIGVSSVQTFNVSGSDANGDAISYTWTVDNAPSPYLPTPGVLPGNWPTNTFNPGSDPAILGSHTIKLVASDGHETTQKQWTVHVNGFSQQCNNLFNNPTHNGYACTLVGTPSIGDDMTVGANETDNQQNIRIMPSYLTIDRGTDGLSSNVIFSDALNHMVWYYNRDPAPISRFGITIPAYTVKAIAGARFAGYEVLSTPYKFNNPYGVAVNNDDPGAPLLYIADGSNNRVYEIDNFGNLTTIFGGGASVDAAGSIAGTSVSCTTPLGLAYRLGSLYIGCNGSHTIWAYDVVAATASQIVRSGGVTTDGTFGNGGTARTISPRTLKIDSSGNLFWIETCSNNTRGGVIRAYRPSGGVTTIFGVGFNNGDVKTVVGQTAIGGAGTACANTVGNFNVMRFYHAYDLEITPTGMWVTGYNGNRIYFLNNSGLAQTFGGVTVPDGQGQAVLNAAAGCTVFNDGSVATNACSYNPLGLAYTGAPDFKLFYSDYNFYRVRNIDLSIPNGRVYTNLGGGILTYGSFDSDAYGPDVLLYNPRFLTVDGPRNHLYVGDYSNQRIKRVDLTSGVVTNYAGKTGGAYTNNSHRTLGTVIPGGMTMYNQHLIFANTPYAGTGVNRACMIRTLNTKNVVEAAFFGQNNIAANSLFTLAGDYNLGCLTNTNATFGAGVPGTTEAIHDVEGVAVANDPVTGNPVIYFSVYNNHCLMKLDSTGTMSVAMGTCNVQGNAGNGPIAAAQLRFPRGIVTDPLNPTNLFIVDQSQSATVNIRYINFSNSVVNNDLFTLSVDPQRVQTILSLAGTPWIGDVAAKDDQLCYSTGRNDTPSQGNHNVICQRRDKVIGFPATLRCGIAVGDPLKGSGPLGNEQEDVDCSAIYLSGSYGLSFDDEGNLYIADRMNHIIRFVKKWY